MMVRKVLKDNLEVLGLQAPQVNVDHQDQQEKLGSKVPQGL